jgi:hypothetical protein
MNKYPLKHDDDSGEFIAFMFAAACAVGFAWFVLVWWFWA